MFKDDCKYPLISPSYVVLEDLEFRLGLLTETKGSDEIDKKSRKRCKTIPECKGKIPMKTRCSPPRKSLEMNWVSIALFIGKLSVCFLHVFGIFAFNAINFLWFDNNTVTLVLGQCYNMVCIIITFSIITNKEFEDIIIEYVKELSDENS